LGLPTRRPRATAAVFLYPAFIAISLRWFVTLVHGAVTLRRGGRVPVMNAAFFVAGGPASGHEWPGAFHQVH
jgi:hypothetical protein